MAKKPLNLRPGRPLPDPEKIDWSRVSEVHSYLPVLDAEEKKLLNAANQTHRLTIVGKTPEAQSAIERHFF